jgi:Cu/Ag efflux protein CusF
MTMKLMTTSIVSGILGIAIFSGMGATLFVYAADSSPSLIEALEPEAAKTRAAAGELQSTDMQAEEVVSVTATVKSVDPETRLIKLEGPDGKKLKVTAGSGVRNLDQLNAGDQITISYMDARLLSLHKGTSVARQGEVAMGAFQAETGTAPAGGVMRSIDLIASVEGLDATNRVVTLKGLQRSTGPGRPMLDIEDADATITLTVPDTISLADIQVGDKVRATYLQGVAVSVESGK